jgi:hypothetical protein
MKADNLIDELSVDYCNELLSGALFVHNGKRYEFLGAKTGKAGSVVIAGQAFRSLRWVTDRQRRGRCSVTYHEYRVCGEG